MTDRDASLSNSSTASRRIAAAVLALTALGLALRLARFDQSFFGDESSTLYLTDGRSLGDVISLISSDAEITPPLYFVLAWFSLKLGSAPDLVRLPSLVSGTLLIPLVYLLGARLLSRPAGLLAATVITLSPGMIFASGDGRSYALMIALVVGSTLSMLIAIESSRTRWWVVYGLCSCLAMYSHYTAAFVLLAQLGWLLWVHPQARVPALIANAAAAVLFAPWLPSVHRDSNSPTLDVLSQLQGKSFAAKRYALEIWSAGYPFRTPSQVPGVFAAVVGFAGIVVASAASLFRLRRGADLPPFRTENVVLALLLLLAAPVLELVVWAITGNDLFGPRNLGVATPGLALVIGLVLVGAGRRLGVVCAVAVIACFAIGAGRTLQTANSLPNLKAAADYIDAQAGPDDVIVDLLSARVTPVPLTSLDSYLSPGRPEFRLLLPEGEPPFLVTSPIPPSKELLREAVRTAEQRGSDLFVVATAEDLEREGDEVSAILAYPQVRESGPPERFALPPGSRVVDEVGYGGIGPVNVYRIELGSQSADGDRKAR